MILCIQKVNGYVFYRIYYFCRSRRDMGQPPGTQRDYLDSGRSVDQSCAGCHRTSLSIEQELERSRRENGMLKERVAVSEADMHSRMDHMEHRIDHLEGKEPEEIQQEDKRELSGSPSPRFCKHCGSKVPDDSVYCPKCGSRL